MSKFILLALLSVSSIFAQEKPATVSEPSAVDVLLQDNQLSLLYQRGPYLLFDCQNGHWVCTAKPEYERCKNERSEVIAEKFRSLPCASLKVFETEKACQLKQQELIDAGFDNHFCINKEINDEVGKY